MVCIIYTYKGTSPSYNIIIIMIMIFRAGGEEGGAEAGCLIS